MSRVGLICSQTDRWNAGIEPAAPSLPGWCSTSELIPCRLGAHETLGTHRAMGSVSAPDGQENPNQGTRTPPNLKLTGCPAVEAMTAWSPSPPLDSLSSVYKKALFDNPTRAFFKFLEGCLCASPSRRSWKGQRMLASPSLAGAWLQRDWRALGNRKAVGTAPMKSAGLDVPECTCLVRVDAGRTGKGARL